MIHLGSIPIILDIFVVSVVAVWLFARFDRFADRVLAQLHPLRLNGRRARGILLSSHARRPSTHSRRS